MSHHKHHSNHPATGHATDAADNHSGLALAPTHEEIAAQAYEIYTASGKQSGCCKTNWEQAERQLSERSEKQEAVQALENEGGGIVGSPSATTPVNGGAPLRNGPLATTSSTLVPRQ